MALHNIPVQVLFEGPIISGGVIGSGIGYIAARRKMQQELDDLDPKDPDYNKKARMIKLKGASRTLGTTAFGGLAGAAIGSTAHMKDDNS